MIQRFNFYDIYGYLIPGLAVVVVLWLPRAIVSGQSMDTTAGDIAMALALGYVIGHFVQNLASNAFSAKFVRDADGNPAYPSAIVFGNLQEDVQLRIAKLAWVWFEMDVSVGQRASGAVLDRRQAVFDLCRPIVNARTPYAEQFQGLSTMARGLFLALNLGAAELLGWLVGSLHARTLSAVLADAVAAALLASLVLSVFRVLPDQPRRRFFDEVFRARPGGARRRFSYSASRFRTVVDAALLGLLVLILVGLSSTFVPVFAATFPPDRTAILAGCLIACVAVSLRFLALYYYFADQFARAVWKNFAVEPVPRPA
ncbi:MAG TPA: hypothetical protein VMD91_04415 [Candidatus Sulfotelmatobacter sp.]|nr:hypothetical protein [Candidatus Sulfotelmatobacter sp.]